MKKLNKILTLATLGTGLVLSEGCNHNQLYSFKNPKEEVYYPQVIINQAEKVKNWSYTPSRFKSYTGKTEEGNIRITSFKVPTIFGETDEVTIGITKKNHVYPEIILTTREKRAKELFEKITEEYQLNSSK